jgi:ABC-type glutathione transport system ATPase component
MTEPLLRIEDLHVTFSTRQGLVEAVRGVTLSLASGEMLGLVGESGSGKSVTGFATTRLLDAAGRVTRGRILYRGQDITRIPDSDFRVLHGPAMSMIFQNPRAALNPIRAIGLQIADAILSHKRMSKEAASEEALELLRAVQIRDPETRMSAYPHELSGGMCQRVMIAIAISCNPMLLIADEPTTGLDVTTQKVVMDLLAGIAAARGMATILITHDLGLAAQYCRRVVVMEKGLLVEEAPPASLFRQPQHAYTKRLVAASPTAFSRIEDLVTDEERGAYLAVLASCKPQPEPSPGTPPLLDVINLAKRYDQGPPALSNFSMTIKAGESVGLVGESGSGKTTLGRLLVRLLQPTSGGIQFDGVEIGRLGEAGMRPLRARIQMIFQDPQSSLNPRLRLGVTLTRPLQVFGRLKGRQDQRDRAAALLDLVGLPTSFVDRYPHELSGGQRQRAGIARALALEPDFIVADEIVSGLDVSTQAHILLLLRELRARLGLTMVFISHDLSVVRVLCDDVAILQHGEIVEYGSVARIFNSPQHAYTRQLLSAIPLPDVEPGWLDDSSPIVTSHQQGSAA